MLKFLRRGFSTRNPDQFLRVDHLEESIERQSIRGSLVSVIAQIIKFTLQIGSIVILGRLLSPEDYGLIGMVQVMLVFVGLFGDLGLGAATIQASQITHQQVSNLFWINVTLGAVLAATTALLSPLIAWFYSEPRLIGITIALGIGLFISGFAPQHEALLKRQMHFTSLALLEVVSLFNGILIAIVAALHGLEYWSLVLLQLAMAITRSIGTWFFCGWRPSLPRWETKTRSMLKFGSNLTGFYIFHYFSRNFDNILIGRFWGAQQLGLYSKSYQLLMLPIQQLTTPITSVALTVLSRLRDEPERYANYYYKTIMAISTLGMPIVAFMFATTDKMVIALLGTQWIDTVPIFQCLAPAAFLGLFTWTGWVYQSLGRTHQLFQWGIISSSVDVIAFLIGVQWGAMGVAVAFSLSQLILLVPTFVHCFSNTPLQLAKLAMTLWRPAFASINAAAIVMIGNQVALSKLPLFVSLGLNCMLFATLYVGIWVVLPGGRQILADSLNLFKSLKSA